ncbi:MAG: hypothetical protein EBY65_04000, partial [Acidimicrobiia bacterium]|nr:hypothetical protein [Acidimicrobiia bacterium]
TEQAAAERARALDYHYQAEAEGDDVNQWVYQLINKGEEFQNLALHPTARALATHILGAEHILSSLDAHITHPGNKTMPLHADQWWMPQPVAPGTPHGRQGDMTRETGPFGEPTRATVPINPPLVANMMWMANDFTVANGATRIVPGSHLSGCLPDPERTDYGEIPIEAPAGSVLVWEGRTWHAAGLNTADHPRYGVVTYFCGPIIRSLGNLTYGMRTEVRESMSQELATLCGFTPWSSYGMTDHPSAMVASPGDETAGRLS